MTRTPGELTDPPRRARSTSLHDVLTDVLSMVRLDGAVFLRAEFTMPWAFESSPQDDIARICGLRPKRPLVFYLVAEGRLWIGLGQDDQREVGEGKVIVLPYGERHILANPQGMPPVPVSTLVATAAWGSSPAIRHGGGGARTSVVCGYLWCEDPIFDPILRALPPVFAVEPQTGPTADWISASVQYALDVGQRGASIAAAAIRLPELLLREVLRLHLEGSVPGQTGWLAALRDPVVGPALLELHADPGRRWTVEELARRTATSRSSLAERFGRLLGRAPMQYLGEWRLQIAVGLLLETALSVAEVGNRVGYRSEEAFSRAFRRSMGVPPAQWRLQRAAKADARPSTVPAA